MQRLSNNDEIEALHYIHTTRTSITPRNGHHHKHHHHSTTTMESANSSINSSKLYYNNGNSNGNNNGNMGMIKARKSEEFEKDDDDSDITTELFHDNNELLLDNDYESNNDSSNSSRNSNSSNCNRRRHENELKLLQLKEDIQRWKKFLNIANSTVLLVTFTIIMLYFTTDIFPNKSSTKAKDHVIINVTQVFESISNRCLNETIIESNDVGSFVTCSTFCSAIKPCCDVVNGGHDKDNDDYYITTTFIQTTTNNNEEVGELLCPYTTSNNNNNKIQKADHTHNPNHHHYSTQKCNHICTPIHTQYKKHFKKYISTICDKSTIVKSKDAFHLCQQQCMNFECCFSLDEDENCLGGNDGDAGLLLCSDIFDSCLSVRENAAMFGYGLGPQQQPIPDPAD